MSAPPPAQAGDGAIDEDPIDRPHSPSPKRRNLAAIAAVLGQIGRSGERFIPEWIPYCGAAPVPAEWLARWNLDPLLLGALALAAALHFRSGDIVRGTDHAKFAAALVVLAIIFISPLCALSSALFSVRTAHHLLLIGVAAPLLVLSRPSAAARLPGDLTIWTAAQTLAIWLWHAPPAYEAALSSDLVYWTMQLALIASAVGFWAAIRRAPAPSAAIALVVTMLQMGLLGAIITFAGRPLYAPHLLTTSAWGLSPLQDQQIAGLVMWIPASAIYLAAALLLLMRSLRHEQGPRPAA